MRLNISLGGIAVVQIMAAFALQIVVIRFVGDPVKTDAWVAAQTIPLVLFSFFSVAFQGTWQTAFAQAAGDVRLWSQLQRQAQGQLLLVVGLALGAIGLAAPLWVPLLFPGFSDEQASITADIARILLFGTLLNSQAALLLTALRSRDRFISGELAMLAGALLGLLITIIALPTYGILGAAWANTTRLLLTVAVLFVLAGRPVPSLTAGLRAREHWPPLQMLLGGGVFYKITPLVDRYFGSLALVGGLTLFNLSQNALQALSLVIDRAFVTPSGPALARLIKARDWQASRALYRKTLARSVAPFVISAAGLLALYPFWILLIRLVLKIELQDHESWSVTAALLGFLYPASAGAIVFAGFYALDDARTPTRISIVGSLASIALKAGFFWAGGLLGLALAISLHYLGNFAVMHWILDRRLSALLRTASLSAGTTPHA